MKGFFGQLAVYRKNSAGYTIGALVLTSGDETVTPLTGDFMNTTFLLWQV